MLKRTSSRSIVYKALMPLIKKANLPQLDEFARAYVEAALWSSMDESTPSGGRPLDESYGIEDIHPETLSQMVSDCADFKGGTLDNGVPVMQVISSNMARAGHDFWLTRNRHGAGFWDGDWGDHGDALTKFSHPYGEVNLYVGDDGMIHSMQG